MSNKTLAILKPDCVRKNLIGQVLSKINEAGFKIKALKMVRLTNESASGFYEIHKERPFFNDLLILLYQYYSMSRYAFFSSFKA